MIGSQKYMCSTFLPIMTLFTFLVAISIQLKKGWNNHIIYYSHLVVEMKHEINTLVH